MPKSPVRTAADGQDTKLTKKGGPEKSGKTDMKEKILEALYQLKKSVLYLESKVGSLKTSNDAFDNFIKLVPAPTTEAQLYAYIITFDQYLFNIISKCRYPDFYKIHGACTETYTCILHGRSCWNEIPNDKSVNYFLDHFKEIKGLDQYDGVGNFELVLYDLNDQSFFFESEEDARQFAEEYNATPSTLYEIHEYDREGIWVV